MNKCRIALFSIVFMGIFANAFAVVNWHKIREMPIEEVIELLNNPSSSVRSMALDLGVPKYLEDERMRLAIIELTIKETKYLIKNKDVDEGYGEYYIEILETLMKIDDKRIVPLLVDSFAIVGGNRLTDKLAEYGDYAAELVMKKLEDKNVRVKLNAAFALNRMLEKKAVSIKMKNNIKIKMLDKAQNDKDEIIKERAIEGLGLLSEEDDEALAVLKSVAKKDKYVIRIKGKPERYPLRDKAKKILKEIEKKRKDKTDKKNTDKIKSLE